MTKKRLTGLFRLLSAEEDAPVPIEWWVSRVCEEFQCLPSEALREWREAPLGLLETIMEYRLFAQAKRVYDHADAKTLSALAGYRFVELVKEIDLALAEEALRGSPTPKH